ncbi:MAG TPA: DoxX family protein [Anaeromyxobacter sp.]|nr:DoxX family protein [Anaeromyxobacter sp.]
MTEAYFGKRRIWAGRILSALPVLLMVLSAIMKLVGGPEMMRNWASFGYPPSTLVPIGILEIACALLYVIPRTSVLGAAFVTAYLGGAVATHVRVLQSAAVGPAVLGALAWVGLYLREARLRPLFPWRSDG